MACHRDYRSQDRLRRRGRERKPFGAGVSEKRPPISVFLDAQNLDAVRSSACDERTDVFASARFDDESIAAPDRRTVDRLSLDTDDEKPPASGRAGRKG